MMKLAFYLPSLRGGGAERVMVTLANGFAERGHAVDLVLASAEGPYLADVASDVRVVNLAAGRVVASLPGLVGYLRRERPLAMLSALGHANVIAVLARALARVSTRLIVSERSHFSESQRQAQGLRARMMGRVMRLTYPYADSVVAVSAGVADDLARCIGLQRERIAVVYNPVVTPTLAARARAPVSHTWFSGEGPPVVLGVGRLTAAKDFPTLIRAFAQLRALQPARLVILGEGELRPALVALVAELGLQADVSLPGFVDNPFAYMRRSALFVLSSAWEGLPNVLVQAMACGTPVVSTECPSGPAEILEGGKWGRLVPVGDETALANAMAAALAKGNPPGVAARAAVFSVENAVEGYLRVMLPELANRKTEPAI